MNPSARRIRTIQDESSASSYDYRTIRIAEDRSVVGKRVVGLRIEGEVITTDRNRIVNIEVGRCGERRVIVHIERSTTKSC